MRKQYNHYQGENKISQNNFCAGYALDAILYNMGLISAPDPLNRYNNIQNIQNTIVEDEESLTILNNNTLNDTRFSFPSAIVGYIQQTYKNRPIVNMERSRLPYSNSIVDAEMKRMGSMGITVGNSSMEILNDQTHSHHMLLVNNGTHWISVVNENGTLYMYDPGNPNFRKVTLAELDAVYSGIIITLD